MAEQMSILRQGHACSTKKEHQRLVAKQTALRNRPELSLSQQGSSRETTSLLFAKLLIVV
jgi:hypothetical protein